MACGTSDAEGAGSNEIKASSGYTQKSDEVGVCKTTWTRTATKAPITVACP